MMVRWSIPMDESQIRSFQPSVNASMKVPLPRSGIASGDSFVLLGLSKRLGFIGRLLILVSRRRIWSPFRILDELFLLVTSIGTQREILRLLKLQPFAQIVQDSPELPFKYLIPDYLVRGLTVTERASLFLHHYRRIHSALSEDVLCEILQREVILYEIAKNGNQISVTLSSSRYPFEKEGELSLNLQVDGKEILNLCFTIVPGWVLKSEAPEVLLISRLQGNRGCNSQIKLARKAFNDYSARSLLLAALQGIADALGVGEIAAVCATNQRCYSEGRAVLFKNGYDEFFTRAGMVRTSVGFFSSPIPIEAKPLSLFKGHARARARKRRANRQQIRSACADFLSEKACRAAAADCDTICLTAVLGPEPHTVPFSTPDYNQNL